MKKAPALTLYGETGGQHILARLVDHAETFGPHVMRSMAAKIPSVDTVVDLGAGTGRDLDIIRSVHPKCRTSAVELGRDFLDMLEGKADEIHVANIERDSLPFADESVDLVIANQVLEHTKEVFWIFHEVTRSLKVGGHFIFGVPNVTSLHNRLLMLAGIHPTQHKLCSAHVRPFSKGDTVKFLEHCFPGGYSVRDFQGSQFYPLPKVLSRPLCAAFPSASTVIFFMIQKRGVYVNSFATYPSRAHLHTNFWSGDIASNSQY
jgi:SAM-dependent methyltransferase